VSVREISASELATLVERGGAVVDVREPDEYREGHVPGARLIPLTTVPDSLDVFRQAVPVYVICHSGARSMRACEFLHEAGITNVVNVAGGTAGFAALGHDLRTGDQP
jgi:rhodanese-related sulfurtransferase